MACPSYSLQAWRDRALQHSLLVVGLPDIDAAVCRQ